MSLNEIKSNYTFDLFVFFSIVSSVTLPIEQCQHQVYPTAVFFHRKQRGRLQRGRQQTLVLIGKPLTLHVHFFVALYKTTTLDDQIRGLMQYVNTRRCILLSFLFLNLKSPLRFLPLDSLASIHKLKELEISQVSSHEFREREF